MTISKICLITDVHLSVQGESANNIDTRSNYQVILKAIKEESPEHIIVAGDICFRYPEESVYLWAKEMLDNIGIGYSVISGNHDNSKFIHKYFHPDLGFNEDTNEIYYVKYIADKKFIFLDTAVGEMSDAQWKWLEDNLDTNNEEESLIVMHHPPVIAGVPHMDIKYAFKEMDRFQALCRNYTKDLKIFTGHYHVERFIQKGNLNVFITPSCFVQIDDRYEEFVADHYKIGYRNILIGENYFQTSIRYMM